MKRRKRIYLNKDLARVLRLFQSREEWINRYCNPEKISYIDVAKGAPLLVCIEGFYIFDKDLEKIMSFKDRQRFAKCQDYSLLRWNID